MFKIFGGKGFCMLFRNSRHPAGYPEKGLRGSRSDADLESLNIKSYLNESPIPQLRGLNYFELSAMATITETMTVTAPPSQTKDLATRLFNGTLHAAYPPIEQFMTIDGLLKDHAEQPDQAKRPLISYPVRKADDYEEHTAGDLDKYTDLAARYYIEKGLPPAVR